jgi:hypothetical protein
MTKDELREAIEIGNLILAGYEKQESFAQISSMKDLISVAEGVLRLPEEKEVSGYDHGADCYHCDGCFQEGRNQTIIEVKKALGVE